LEKNPDTLKTMAEESAKIMKFYKYNLQNKKTVMPR
jgi:hypothetical protein